MSALTPQQDQAETIATGSSGSFRRRWSVIMLVTAVTTFGLAAWAERQQQHSHLWTVDGDRFQLTSFLAPAHHHTREIPFSGIESITGEADLERPEVTILVLHYGAIAFRMPSQCDETITRFDAYVERLEELLAAAHSGDESARVLYLDPYLVVTATAAAASLVAWIFLFVTVLRPRRRTN
jgi:hypothetical protein